MRTKLGRLARDLRFEDAARLRNRLTALEELAARVDELDRLRRLEVCLLAPARERGFRRLFVVSGGRIAAARTIPDELRNRLDREAALATAGSPSPQTHGYVERTSFSPEDADDLLVIAGFLRRPGPELRVVSRDEILAA